MGGMGGMGGMGMGGGGGGFRSVPPTSLPFTTLKPKQTRHLPTNVASLTGPNEETGVGLPAKGDRFRVGAIEQISRDERTGAALKRLAREKAPPPIAQLVLWNVSAGLDWGEIATRSEKWANASEITLARQFVDRLDAAGRVDEEDSGVLCYEITGNDADSKAVATDLRKLFEKAKLVGLETKAGIPAEPRGPGVSCRIVIDGAKVVVHVRATNADGTQWNDAGTFRVKASDVKNDAKKTIDAAKLADAVASGLLGRLVHAQLSPGPRVKGKPSYRIKIENASPLILNGVALAGSEISEKTPPSVLSGICVSPRKSMTIPAPADLVDRLKLKAGVRVLAADLSGL
jgi:hypothetical protein